MYVSPTIEKKIVSVTKVRLRMQRILKAYEVQQQRLQSLSIDSIPKNDGNNNAGRERILYNGLSNSPETSALNEIVSAIDSIDADAEDQPAAKRIKLTPSKCTVPVRKQPARSSKQSHPHGCQSGQKAKNKTVKK